MLVWEGALCPSAALRSPRVRYPAGQLLSVYLREAGGAHWRGFDCKLAIKRVLITAIVSQHIVCWATGGGDTTDDTTLRTRLRYWLLLSVHRDVPSSLLILTAAFLTRRHTILSDEIGSVGVKQRMMQIRYVEKTQQKL